LKEELVAVGERLVVVVGEVLVVVVGEVLVVVEEWLVVVVGEVLVVVVGEGLVEEVVAVRRLLLSAELLPCLVVLVLSTWTGRGLCWTCWP